MVALAQDLKKKLEIPNLQNMEIKEPEKIQAESKLQHYRWSLKDLWLGFRFEN